MSKLSTDDLEVLYIVSAVSAGLSLIGNFFIIFLYLYIKKLRLYVFRLVFYISICDCLKSITLLLPNYRDNENEAICEVLGYFFAYSALSGSIWVLAIAVSLNQILVKNHHHIERYHKVWVLVAFFLTAFVSGFPFITRSYGFSSGWCTLKENSTGRIWKFFMFYLPSWIIIIIIIIVYIRLARSLKISSEVNDTEINRNRVIKRIIAYPLIMIITFLPITLVRILYLTSNTLNIYLLSFAYFFYGIYGFLNTIAYGYNDVVIKNVKASILGKKVNYSVLGSEI